MFKYVNIYIIFYFIIIFSYFANIKYKFIFSENKYIFSFKINIFKIKIFSIFFICYFTNKNKPFNFKFKS